MNGYEFQDEYNEGFRFVAAYHLGEITAESAISFLEQRRTKGPYNIFAYCAGEIALEAASLSHPPSANNWLLRAAENYENTRQHHTIDIFQPGVEFAARAKIRQHQLPILRSIHAEKCVPSSATINSAYRKTLAHAQFLEATLRANRVDLRHTQSANYFAGYLGELAVLLLGQRAAKADQTLIWVPVLSMFHELRTYYFTGEVGSGWNVSVYDQESRQSPYRLARKVQVRTMERPSQATTANDVTRVNINPDLVINESDPPKLARSIIRTCGIEVNHHDAKSESRTHELDARTRKLLEIIRLPQPAT